MDSISPTDFLKKLEYCTHLPSPPGVAVKIIELNQNPDICINDVVDIIKLDPALSTKLIRMANSPLYARRHKTENLRQAVIHFGPYNSLTFILSFSLTRALNKKSKSNFNYPVFWRRSLASAIACQLIAEHLGLNNTDECFLAGLIQDIGMIIIDKYDDNFYNEALDIQTAHINMVNYEIDKCGINHAEVGAWVFNKWNFPDLLISTVKGSHDSLATNIDNQYEVEAKIIALSSTIADVYCVDDMQPVVSMAIDRAKNLLDLDEQFVIDVINNIYKEIQTMSELYEINIGDDSYISSISDKANELLMLRSIETSSEAVKLKNINNSLLTQTAVLEMEKRLDHLTKLYNRCYLDEVLNERFTKAKAGEGIAVAFIDIDHFKKINDEYGHQVGDSILVEVASTLKTLVREGDEVFRYGGEEFIILFCRANQQGASIVCNRILDNFRTTDYFINTNFKLSLTVSIGISSLSDTEEYKQASDLLMAADKALYAAKIGGRDQVILSDALQA